MDTSLPAAPLATPKGNDKLWSILCHLSIISVGIGLVFPLVVYLAMKGDSDYVAAQAKEALNFHISLLIYCVVCIPLIFVAIGIPLLIVIGFASLVLAIIAAVKASDGASYRYPLTLRLVS